MKLIKMKAEKFNIPLQIKNFPVFQNFSWHFQPLGFQVQLSIPLPQGELPVEMILMLYR